MSLARLVLGKSALCGLRVLFWDETAGAFQDGSIQLYDEEHDCFMISLNESSFTQHGVQFHQFMVEQEEHGQLLLKVTKCTVAPVPDKYRIPISSEASIQSNGNSAETSVRASEAGGQQNSTHMDNSTWGTAAETLQLATQLSAELSQQLSGLVGQSFSQTGDGFQAVLPEMSTPIELPAAGHMRTGQELLDEPGSEEGEGGFWGSPVKQHSSVLLAEAIVESIPCSASLQLCDEAVPAAASGFGCRTSCSSSSSSTVSDTPLYLPATDIEPSTMVAAAAATTGATAFKSSTCFSSFKEISRMISQTEDTPGSSRHNSKSSHPISIAARLLEEPGTWGTPREASSSWGSPREHRSGAAAALEHEEPAETSLPSFSLPVEVSATAAAAAAEDEEDAGACWPPHDGMVQDCTTAPNSAVVLSAAEETSSVVPREDLDFTIPVGVLDAPIRPASRASSLRSSRERLHDGPVDATDEGMMVDIPQPLSSRRVSRTSARHLYMPSDPGFGAALSTTAGSAELRRTVSNMGASASRRISRNNADQDWAITAPDGQLLPQHMQQHAGVPINSAAGTVQPLHVPGPVSRRASRTLSGRLLDQDGTVMLVGQLDDAEPDVLTRPVTATSIALDTIVSRHHSASGRNTPDSDELGFGFSEGIEPLVPPEEAQHAALAEAAQQTVVEGPAASAPAAGHSRPYRRSHRSIPAAAAAAVPQLRSSMRLSDQDEHQPEILPGLIHGSSHPPLRQSISSIRLTDQVIEEAHSFRPEQEPQMPHQQEQQQQQDEQQGQQQLQQPGVQGTKPRLQQLNRQSSNTLEPSGPSPTNAMAAADCSMSGSAFEPGSSHSSRRSVPGILQAAAAVAAVAEAAAAAAVGFALGGRGTPAELQALEGATVVEAAAAIPSPDDGNALHQAGTHSAQQQPEIQEYAAFVAGISKKVSRQMQDSFVTADSFSCPPFIPLSGVGSSSKLNPFADSSLFSFGSNQLNSSSSSTTISAFIGTMPVEATIQAAQLAATGGSFSSPGSPCGATAALLRKQQLLPPAASVEGSEWGSGALLGPHLTSGIDSPTGSAVFRSNPFDGADSTELTSLEPASAAGPMSGTGGKGGIGASRMKREAAATFPFAGLTAATTNLKYGVGINEITPADEESDDEKISSYRSSGAGLLHSNFSGAAAVAAVAASTPSAADDAPDAADPVPNSMPTTAAAAAALAPQKSLAAAPTAETDSRITASSDSDSVWIAPPSYADSVGAMADDECSPSAATANTRRVWPAEYAAAARSSDGCSSSSDNRGVVRLEAELDSAVSGAMGQQLASGRASTRQLEVEAGGATGATGLLKRNVSRTPSQALEGMVVLGNGGGFNYEDDDNQPLMVMQQRGAMGCAAGQVPRGLQEARIQVGRAALDALAANSAHFFDSIAFVVLGGQLITAMGSPAWSQQKQLGGLFAIFAAGHVLWILGCLLWPWVTGRFGRRTALAWTIGLSAFPTALLGCMPSFAEGGVAGIAVIAVLRCLSGLSLGNEGPSTLVYLTEHAPQFPCLHASLVPCAMAAGAFGASAVALFFSWVLSAASLGVFGWRLVLVTSLLVNAVNVVLRGFVLQDPEHHMSAAEITDRRNNHLWRVLRHHPGKVLVAFGLQAFAATGLFLLTAWMPVYYVQLTDLAPSLALTVHTVNTAVLTASIPLGGFLADKYGRTSLLLATLAAAALFGYPAWLLFQMTVPVVSWFCQFMLVLFVGLHWGGLAEALIECFPRGVRASALSVAFVLPMILLGSVAPLMALGLIMKTGSLASPAFVMIIMSVVTAATVLATQLARN